MKNKGSGIGTLLWKFLRHRLLAGHRNGHGIHSPFVYDFARKVVFNKDSEPLSDQVTNSVKSLGRTRERLVIHDLGAGSRVSNADVRVIGSIARKSSVSPKQGRLLQRISAWYAPGTVIELGTGLGISTAYLAAGAPFSKIISVEGSAEKYVFAGKFLDELGFPSIELLNADFEEVYPGLLDEAEGRVMVFIDGDHRYEPSMRRSLALLNHEKISEAVLILDDIYWSKEMEAAWRDLSSLPGSLISIDLFYFGIIIKRPDIARQHYRIKF